MLPARAAERVSRAGGAIVAAAVAACEAANLYLVGGHHQRGATAIALLAAAAAPLVVWRRFPLNVSVACAAATVAMAALDVPHLGLGALAGVFGASYWGSRAARRAALGLLIVGVPTVPLLTEDAANIPRNAALYAAAWVFGWLLRERRASSAELEARARELEREREQNATLAAAAERSRIARELHDVLTHSMSVIVVQAQAGQAAAADGVRARRTFERIEAVGRESLTELRRLLGSVRTDADEPALAPQPGLDRLDDLVTAMREAGVTVSVVRDGARSPLPALVDLSAYRIVQEALTNTLRHAEIRAAEVRVRYGPEEVEVEVRDEGRPADGVAGHRNGRGLTGMRERALLCGGTLEAGDRPEGGFSVVARLPLGAAP